MAAKKRKPKKAPAKKKPVPLNELYPSATSISWVQRFLRQRSK